MIKINFKIYILLAITFFGCKVAAQQAIVASGGEGSGSGGTISYSIGLIDYSVDQNASHVVEQGVQHPDVVPIPIATSPQNFCHQSNLTLANIVISGSNVKWYDSAFNGNLLPNTTVMNNGTTTYYATQTIGGKESHLRKAVTVNASDLSISLNTKANSSCLTGGFGSASINTPSNGVAPFTYDWAPGNPTGDGTASVTGLVPGNYTCTVTDAIGCVSNTIDVAILQGTTQVSLSINFIANSSCFGANNGVISINNPSNGTAPYTFNWSHNATINNRTVASLPPGNYTCIVTDANGCQASISATITEPPLVEAPLATSPQALCGPSTLSNITITGQNIKWYSASTGGILLADTTAIVSGTTYYASQTVNGCESPSRAAVTVTVGTAPIINTQPANVTITEGQTTAFSVSASNVVSRQWQYSTDNGNSWNNLTDSGGVPTVLGATNGAVFLGNVPTSWNGYQFRVLLTNASCSNIPSNTATLTVNSLCSAATTWNGNTWSNGLPNSTTQAIFSGNFNSTASLQTCKVSVNNSASVVINSGHTLSAEYDINVASGSSLTVENNAAIKQTNNVTNTGNVIVKRNSAPMIRLDYTAWSSPVQGQQLLAFSPNTLINRFYVYNPLGINTPTSFQPINPNSNFDMAKGYLIRSANDWDSTVYSPYNGVFNGTLNNGIFNIPLQNGYNMIGNPYASPINATLFLQQNPSVTTLYFWTHTIPASGGSYPTNNYASFTNLGGVASAAGGQVPNGFIQVGQGFFAKNSGNTPVQFMNNQRTDALFTTQFFKQSDIEKHRIWINLNGVNAKHNQILVGYMDGATNAIDDAIDGSIIDDTNSVLYNYLDNEKYVIQGRSLPFDDTDVVPLGIKITEEGTYTINLENKDGLFTNQLVYLKDKYNNTFQELNTTGYTFNAPQGTFNDRFEIRYTQNALNTDSFDYNGILIFNNANNEIEVRSANENIAKIEVYDLLGKRMYQKNNINAREYRVATYLEYKVLIVKVLLDNGQIINQKIILDKK